MKKILLILILLGPFSVFAEDVNSASAIKSTKKYEINSGDADLTGDKSTLRKTAELNWKKACDDWRAELKESNKNNIIISQSCGKMICTKEGVETTCTSKAQYKIKILVEE